MLKGSSAFNFLPLYNGTQTVTGMGGTTITPTASGFVASQANNARVSIVPTAPIDTRQLTYIIVVARVAHRECGQYLQLRFSTNTSDATNSPLDRAEMVTLDRFFNFNTDLSATGDAEWQLFVFPVSNLNSPTQMSASEQTRARSFEFRIERGVKAGPATVEIKEIYLASLKPTFALGIDDGFTSDYTVIYQACKQAKTNIPWYSAIPYRGIEIGNGPGAGGYINAAPAPTTMTVNQMLEMRDSGIWTFVNHSYQHPSVAGGLPEQSATSTEVTSLSATPTNQPTTYGAGSFTRINGGNGGTIPTDVVSALTYELNTCRDRLVAAGLDVNGSASFFVSPYGAYNSDLIRVLKSLGFIGHRTAEPETSQKFTVPGASPFLIPGILALNAQGIDRIVTSAVMHGRGILSPFLHASGVGEIPGLVRNLKKFEAMQNAGICRFVSIREAVDLCNLPRFSGN